jgi:hypothetical protein
VAFFAGRELGIQSIETHLSLIFKAVEQI